MPEIAKMPERVSISITVMAKVSIFLQICNSQQFNDFSILWMLPFFTAACAMSFNKTGIIYLIRAIRCLPDQMEEDLMNASINITVYPLHQTWCHIGY